MNARQEKLFNDAYSSTFMAADGLAEIYSVDTALDVAKVRGSLNHLRLAVSALTTLESVLAVNPEPKRGDA
jgi:hypothetical protein